VDKIHVFRLITHSDWDGDMNHGIFSTLGLAVQVASGILAESSSEEDCMLSYLDDRTVLIFEYILDDVGNCIATYDVGGFKINPKP